MAHQKRHLMEMDQMKSRAHHADIPKRLGKRLFPKDEEPIVDEEHRQLVGQQPCIVSRYGGGERYCVAHHPRGLFLRTGGKRISDFLCVPLRPDLHDGYGHSLHKAGNEEAWWLYNGLTKERIFTWLRAFLMTHYGPKHPGVRQALAKMEAEEDRT